MNNMLNYSILLVVLYFVNFTQPCPYALEASIQHINSSCKVCDVQKWFTLNPQDGDDFTMLDLDSRDCEFEYKRLGRCGRMAHSPSSYFSSALMSRIKVTMMQHSAHILALLQSMSQVGIGSPYWPGYSRLFLKEDPEGG